MANLKVSVEENTCPICMYILIQPVTMPCKHELCLPCFKQNVEEANFCCPMCRLRISTWARKAARNKALVNQERWQEIMKLFPDKVNKRLNDEDDDDSEGMPVSVKLAKPGEIRTEYEEELNKLRQEYAEQRKKEQEASELLIRKLQEEESKKRNELDSLEKQDEELAKELSDIMNKADLFSPYSTRSGSGTSDSESMRSFIESMKANNQAGASPYPYPCFTPTANGKVCVDKDRALLLEENFRRQKVDKEKHLLTTQDLLNLEKQFKLTGKRCNSKASATVGAESAYTESRTNSTHSLSSIGQNSSLSQDEILQQMSDQLDLGVNLLDSPDCIIIEPKSTDPLEKKGMRLTLKNNRNSNTSMSSVELVELESHDTNQTEDRNKKLTVKVNRSASSQSNDSISQELAHFRPIRACPLTPPRQLSGGKVVEPLLIRTTPRNLSKSLSVSEDKTLSDIDASSPIMQKCLEQLEEERKDKVVQMSKSTTTRPAFQNSENKNPNNLSLISPPVNGLSISTRTTEFKDISNSPLAKRKCDFDEVDMHESVKRKKLIIPLEPDLNENDDQFEVSPFKLNLRLSPMVALKKKAVLKKPDSKASSRSSSRSKSKEKQRNGKNTARERGKVKEGVQSAITKWTLKQDVNTLSNDGDETTQVKERSFNQTHKQSDSHTHKQSDSHKPKKEIKNAINLTTLDNYFAKSAEKKPKLRSRDSRRILRLPEYDYPDISPKKRKNERSIQGNGAISKLSFDSDNSGSECSESATDRLYDFDNSETHSPIEHRNAKTASNGCRVSKRMHTDVDEVDSISFPVFKTKRKLTDTEKIPVKKRFKSGPISDKLSRQSIGAGIASNSRKTVDTFFKVNGNNEKKSNCSVDAFIHRNMEEEAFGGFVDQEEKDRLLALELQKQFDFEHKYGLNAVRLKGSEESYSFRNIKKSV